MNLAAAMDAVSARLDTITGLRCFAYPLGSPPPVPAAEVLYPESYTYDENFARGMDRMTLPVLLTVAKASDRSARDQLGAYVDGSGASSVKAVLESGTYTAFDTIRVVGAEFGVVSIAATDYLAATFELDIAGHGS